MKKKVLSLALCLALAATAVVGGTLAYFTDTDKADNVFVTGNVKIELIENFGDNDPETPEKLLPATGSAQAGTLENGITKEVYVTNRGTEESFVRVHIAIPAILDDGADTFNAGNNKLHFNYAPDSIGEGLWNWSKSDGAPYSGDWNYYETTIDNIAYHVYVVTYGTALKAPVQNGALTDYDYTCAAMEQVYLDSRTTNEDIDAYIEALGENWHILVVAEGAQAAGFDNAYDALNTAFGVPGEYDVDFSGAVKG